MSTVDILKSRITSSVEIRVNAEFKPLGSSDILGGAIAENVHRNFTGSVPNTWYPDALADKLAGQDLSPNQPDLTAELNSSVMDFYFGTDGNTPADQFDFVTLVLHELIHGLSFAGNEFFDEETGKGYVTLSEQGSPELPGIYDSNVVHVNGGNVTAITNTTVFPDSSVALGNALQSGKLFWNGANGIIGAGDGNKPKLYAPATFVEGSSYSHLDEETYLPGNINTLMSPDQDTQESAHDFGPIAIGMFKDMGWTIDEESLPSIAGDITVITNLANASFTITGAGNSYRGTGKSWNQSEVPAGSYTIVYDDVPTYQKPNSETKTLEAKQNLTFTGTYVDIAAPDTMIISGPSGDVKAQEVTFVFTGSDNHSASETLQYAYKLEREGETLAFSTSSAETMTSYTNLGDGSYLFSVKAKDEAGNEDASPATASFQIGAGAAFDLFVPKGIGMIHLPLAITVVNGETMEIKTIGDLYDVIGRDNVDAVITYDPPDGETPATWRSYLGDQNRGTRSDVTITDDLGILTVMRNAVPLNLKGNAWGKDGVSQINLNPGTNFIGVPLMDERIKSVSDLLTIEGIKDNASAIIVSDEGEFKVVTRAGDDGDIDITGGQSFILIARNAGVAEITGEAWDNVSGSSSAAPPMALVGHQVDGQTPVLAVHGAVIDEVIGVAKDGFRVTVRNLSTGATLNTLSGSDIPEGKYSLTFMNTISSRAIRVGDVLKITVQTPSPLIGVQPLHHIVSADEVNGSQVLLPDLIAYEIPMETKLLANYPNPFNPETWIPFRLAEDAFVSLTIYGIKGQVIRNIEVGHQPAAVYESREKAIYWDGRNDFGEGVASGVYFYTLTTQGSTKVSPFTATRKMLILK
ncbi:hypothetical protein IH992_32875 [Candidatus Poribacteria bacterium]|nr:hypothetical protein [Candidatus Poribacteria bacterium]